MAGGAASPIPAGGTPGQHLTKLSNYDWDIGWADVPGNENAPAGRYVHAWPAGAATSAFLTVGQLRLTPFVASYPFDAIYVESVTTAAGATVTLGIYNIDTEGMPTTVRAQGNVSAAAAGACQVTFTTVPRGFHWFAVLPLNVGPTLRTASNTANPHWISATTAQPSPLHSLSCWQLSSQAALPDPWPAGAINQVGAPIAMLRTA